MIQFDDPKDRFMEDIEDQLRRQTKALENQAEYARLEAQIKFLSDRVISDFHKVVAEIESKIQEEKYSAALFRILIAEEAFLPRLMDYNLESKSQSTSLQLRKELSNQKDHIKKHLGSEFKSEGKSIMAFTEAIKHLGKSLNDQIIQAHDTHETINDYEFSNGLVNGVLAPAKPFKEELVHKAILDQQQSRSPFYRVVRELNQRQNDYLNHDFNFAEITRQAVDRQRYLSIIETILSSVPADFDYSKTSVSAKVNEITQLTKRIPGVCETVLTECLAKSETRRASYEKAEKQSHRFRWGIIATGCLMAVLVLLMPIKQPLIPILISLAGIILGLWPLPFSRKWKSRIAAGWLIVLVLGFSSALSGWIIGGLTIAALVLIMVVNE